ncbi:hypothetical protein FRC05_009670 [Tulasnella sp. 425]|nr:hypothetical protein FRC05_009670 [Tulasnella sp. 425]
MVHAAFDACETVNSILDLAKASGIVYDVLDPTPFWKFSRSRLQNGADVSALLSILDEYTQTVWTFINGIPVDHLRYGDKAEIRLAKNVIAAWYFQLEQALQLLKNAGLREKNFLGLFRRARRRRALRRCVKELTTAHERLEGNVAPGELEIVRTVPPTSYYRKSFWNGFVEADVRGQAKLVKVYRNSQTTASDDGDTEIEFYGDLHNLQQKTLAQFPKLFGYCNDPSATFLVFDSMCFTPFKQVVTSLQSTGQCAASQNLWRQFMEMFNAVHYLVENHGGVTWTFLEFTIADARVDDRGTVVVSPRWINTDMSGWDTSRSKFLTLLGRMRHRFFEGEVELRTFKSLFYPYRRRWEQRMYGAVTTGLPESSDLLDRLSEFCPSDYSEPAIRWPLGTVTSDGSVPRAGDVGYFEEGDSMCEMAASFGLGKGFVNSFKILGNVAKDCGMGVELSMVQYENLFGTKYARIEKVGERLFKVTITPPADVLQSDPGLAYQTLDVEWLTALKEPTADLETIQQHARQYVTGKNVDGRSICLTTEMRGLLSFGTIGSFICRLIDPINLFVEFDDSGLLLSARWSFLNDPRSEKGFMEAEKFECPKPTIYHPPFWSWVLSRSLGKLA